MKYFYLLITAIYLSSCAATGPKIDKKCEWWYGEQVCEIWSDNQ